MLLRHRTLVSGVESWGESLRGDTWQVDFGISGVQDKSKDESSQDPEPEPSEGASCRRREHGQRHSTHRHPDHTPRHGCSPCCRCFAPNYDGFLASTHAEDGSKL